MRLSSDQLTRVAAFVEHLEAISAEHGVEVAAHSGTGIVIDGEPVYEIELVNRSKTPGDGVMERVTEYAVESV